MKTAHDLVADPGPIIKALNIVAAALGISSFLGFVNLLVGVLSVGWLGLQAYGYIRYELPRKREQAEIDALTKKIRQRELARMQTKPGDLS